jgi:hypothetical protein
MSFWRRHPTLFWGMVSYLLFAVAVWTPAGSLVLFWPFFLLLSLQTEPIAGISPASSMASFIVNLAALAIVIPWLRIVDKWIGQVGHAPIGTVVLGAISWYIPLLLLQVVVCLLMVARGFDIGF